MKRNAKLQRSNERLENRRSVLRALNGLLMEVGAEALVVDAQIMPLVDSSDLILSVLARRCCSADHKARFREAVQTWVQLSVHSERIRSKF